MKKQKKTFLLIPVAEPTRRGQAQTGEKDKLLNRRMYKANRKGRKSGEGMDEMEIERERKKERGREGDEMKVEKFFMKNFHFIQTILYSC